MNESPIEILTRAGDTIGWDNLQKHLRVSRQCIWNWRNGKRVNPPAKIVLECVALLRVNATVENDCESSNAEKKVKEDQRTNRKSNINSDFL
jgi:hypothetical protein